MLSDHAFRSFDVDRWLTVAAENCAKRSVMGPYLTEVVPSPDALSFWTVYRRLVPGRRLVGHVVTSVHPEDHGKKYIGWPDSSEVGTVSGATWTCACGSESRAMWSRASWARRALIDHWRRMHSDRAVARRGAS